MRAFVTGLDGFAGQWLARELLTAGDDVAGGSRDARPALTVLDEREAGRIAWHPFELHDAAALRSAITAAAPDVVFHLAAQASVADALRDPIATYEANVLGTVRVCEAVRACAPHAAILYAGSAEAYGRVAQADLPIRESAPLRPNNPYAASKAAGEIVALQYARGAGTRVVAARSFNHIGPGQRTAFAVASFAAQVASAAITGGSRVLRVGNLDARRDFTDVRDVARAYRLLASAGQSGSAYNVCSGAAVSMREILDRLVAIAGVDVRIEVDPARLRPSDTPEVVGDPALLCAATGWSPSVPLDRSLEDLYAWHARGDKPQVRPR